MYITHLAALSSLSLSSADNVHTQPPLKAPETRGGMYRHSQEHMHWLSLVWKGVWGAEEARVGMKTVMTAPRRR